MCGLSLRRALLGTAAVSGTTVDAAVAEKSSQARSKGRLRGFSPQRRSAACGMLSPNTLTTNRQIQLRQAVRHGPLPLALGVESACQSHLLPTYAPLLHCGAATHT